MAFGTKYSEFSDKLPTEVSFSININDLATREEVLRWYLQLNEGGTPHSPEELEKVRLLLKGNTNERT